MPRDGGAPVQGHPEGVDGVLEVAAAVYDGAAPLVLVHGHAGVHVQVLRPPRATRV